MSVMLILGMMSCKKENINIPEVPGHKLTVVSNGQGERIVLSGRDFDFQSIKPQADTVVFENITEGGYFISVSRYRFPFKMADRDTMIVFNILNK